MKTADQQRREDDLLEANNRYLARARKGEALLLRAITSQTMICDEDVALHDEIREHLREPWL